MKVVLSALLFISSVCWANLNADHELKEPNLGFWFPGSIANSPQPKAAINEKDLWEEDFANWLMNPKSYGGKDMLLQIKKARTNQTEELNLKYDSYISDLSPIAELTHLTALSLTGFNRPIIRTIHGPIRDKAQNAVRDLSPLTKLVNLKLLSLNNHNISDISPLANLTNLEHLSLGKGTSALYSNSLPVIYWSNIIYIIDKETAITDLTPLSTLTSLVSLNLAQNNISNISALANLTNLEILDLRENPISDISPLNSMVSLKVLKLNDCNLNDLSPLFELKGLNYISLTGNKVTKSELERLKGYLPETEIVFHESIRGGAALVRSDFEASAGHYNSIATHPNGEPYIKIRSQETIQDLEESEEERTLSETEKEEEQVPSFNVTDLGNRWYEHEQFGIFWQSNTEGWYYHSDHGWIYVDEWDDNGTWLYVPLNGSSKSISDSNESVTTEEVGLGWMWSKAEHYPHLYNNEVKDWMYFNKDRNHNRYYSQSIKSYIPEKIVKVLIDDDNTEKWKELIVRSAELLDINEGQSPIRSINESKTDELIKSLKADLETKSYNEPYILTRCFDWVDDEDVVTLRAVQFPITEKVMLRSKVGELNFNPTPIAGYVNLYNSGHESIRGGADLVRSDFEGSIGHYNSVEKHPNGEPYIKIRSQGTIQDLEESEEERTLTETEKEEEQVPSFNVTDLGNRWYEHEQFGIFWQSNTEGWYYHLDHGWIYVDEWDDNGTWLYVPLVERSAIHPYYHFDGVNYSPVIDWNELATSTGLSLEFLKALGFIDPSLFENEGNQTINITDKAEPFGWVWTKASTQNYFYNNRLEEWLFFNKDRLESEARYYSYKHKLYITSKEIRKRDYAQDVWKKMLSRHGFESFVNPGELNGIEVIPDVDKDLLDWTDGAPIIISVNIPKTEIQEDDFWFPLIKNLTELHVDLKKYYRLFEDENFYRLEIRSVLLNEVINNSSHESTNAYNSSHEPTDDTNQEVDAPDDERQASARGLDDNGSEEAILERAGIIDLDDADYERVDKYVEVVKAASTLFEEKVQGRDAYWKDADRFTRDLVSNFDQVVDLIIVADSVGIEDGAILDSLLENSDYAKEVYEIQKEAQNLGIRDKQTLEAVFRNADKVVELKSVINDAKALDIYDLDHIAPVLLNAYQVVSLKKVIEASDEVGAKDKENLGAVFQNADKADELKEVIDVARETLDANDGLGGKKFDYSKASILSSTLKNADKAAELKSVLAIAKDLGVQDEEHLTSVFVNADIALDLKSVVDFAQKYDLTTDNLRDVFQQPEKAEELNELILAETLQTIDDLDEETIQEILQSPTAIAYTLPAREILTASMTKLRAIEKEDVAPEIKTIARGIKIGDIDIGVIADIAVSSKVNAANIPLSEIKDRAEIVQFPSQLAVPSGKELTKAIAEIEDSNIVQTIFNEKSGGELTKAIAEIKDAIDAAKLKRLEDITDSNTASVTVQTISNEKLAVREVNPAESVILELNSTASVLVDNLDSN